VQKVSLQKYHLYRKNQDSNKDSTKYEKQINPTTKAHLIRGAFYLLLLLAVCVIPFALAQRNTTKQASPNGSQAKLGLIPEQRLATQTSGSLS
jgi:hypothetical protein